MRSVTKPLNLKTILPIKSSYFLGKYDIFLRYLTKMSLSHGHLSVSGTRIEVFWVHEAEPSFIFDLHGRCVTPPSMAVHLPYLPGSPLVSHRVLTSFVPPAHNQGVDVAPLQGHALWKKFLSTTGSFYVIVC